MIVPDDVDLFVDLNTEDETGLPWSMLSEAKDPAAIIPGRHIVVGAGSVRAVGVVGTCRATLSSTSALSLV